MQERELDCRPGKLFLYLVCRSITDHWFVIERVNLIKDFLSVSAITNHFLTGRDQNAAIRRAVPACFLLRTKASSFDPGNRRKAWVLRETKAVEKPSSCFLACKVLRRAKHGNLRFPKVPIQTRDCLLARYRVATLHSILRQFFRLFLHAIISRRTKGQQASNSNGSLK